MIQFETLGTMDLRKDGTPVRAVLAQPRRLALLAYLAVARPRGFHSRDRLLGLFWPDADQERARNSLRQALHQLRRALGEDAILARGDREIAVNPEVLRCDAAEFDDAIAGGRLEEALNRYRGGFLPGFFLDSAPEVERFIEEERDRYRQAAVGAAWRLVSIEEARSDARAAAVHARRALSLDPLDEAGLRRTIELLGKAGDRATGLRLYDEFARRLAQDLELTPAQETRRLVEQLRIAEPDAQPGPVLAAASSAASWMPAAPARAVTPDQPPQRTARRWGAPLALAGFLAVASLGAAWLKWRPAPAPATVDDVSAIAVLPFVNITGDPANEYLADGLSEELMAELARIPGLNVAGHTSAFTFKGKDVALDSIGRALRVGHVLEGSVRVTGNRIRIVAALIDTRSGFHAWSDTYDGDLDDVLAVQDRIARAIVGALRPRFRLPAADSARPETADAAAYADLLRGLQAMRAGGPDDFAAAGQFFSRALARDPNYAEAHAGLANVQMTEAVRGLVSRDEGYARAVRSAERALALDPRVAAAHGVLGRVAQDYQWDYTAADRHFRRAIELSPGTEGWYRQRARLLSILGRSDEAIALARRSVALDPLAPGAHRYLGSIQYHARLYDAARESYTRALALVPNQVYSLGSLADALSALGRHTEAIAAADRALAQAPNDPIVLAGAAGAHAAAGDSAEARRILARLLAQPRPSPYLAAEALAQLGDRERMFEMLERAVAEHDPITTEVKVMPFFDPFRDDPRMRRVLERIGLP